MKKSLLIITFLVTYCQYSFSQAQFGIKAGLNYNNSADLIADVNNTSTSADTKVGYHAGLWGKFEIPVIKLYIRPELIYTALNSEYNYSGTLSKSKISKIDVPILLGKKVFKVAQIFVGPSLQYILDSNYNLQDLKLISQDDLTLGMQLGFGFEFGKFGIDVRWERGFSSSESKFIDNNTSNNFTIDSRSNQIILSASYAF